MTEKYTPNQIRENRMAWIAALRSGDYKQGTKVLRNHSGNFCCLGVLCECAGLEPWDGIDSLKYGAIGSGTLAPKEAMEWVGLKYCSGEIADNLPVDLDLNSNLKSLILINDSGVDFETIAEVIEIEPNGLFKRLRKARRHD